MGLGGGIKLGGRIMGWRTLRSESSYIMYMYLTQGKYQHTMTYINKAAQIFI